MCDIAIGECAILILGCERRRVGMGSVRYCYWRVSEGEWEWVVCDIDIGEGAILILERERRRVGMGSVRY